MKSIWGLQKSTNNKNNYEEKYYFTSNSGQVVSEDGSGYVIPLISNDSIQNTEYIPLEYAENKIKSITKESISSQETYKQKMDQMNKYYKNSMNEVKDFYEKHIIDLKTKALRHSEIKKHIYDLQENKLHKDLQQSEKSLDELRDDLANLNKDYQEDMRTLKTELSNKCSENERSLYQISNLQILHSTSQIQGLLNEMIHSIELNDIITNNRNTFNQLSDKFRDIENGLTNQIYSLQKDLQLKEDHFNTESIIRNTCTLALSDILTDIEIKDMKNTKYQIYSLKNKVYESEEVNISHQKYFTELTLIKQLNEHSLLDIENQKAIINQQTQINELQVNELVGKQSNDKLESQLEYQYGLKHTQIDNKVRLCLSNIISTILENNLIKEINENTSILHIVNNYEEKLNQVQIKFNTDNEALMTHIQTIEEKANNCDKKLSFLKSERFTSFTEGNVVDEKITVNQSNKEAKGHVQNNNDNIVADEKIVVSQSNIEAKGLVQNNYDNNVVADEKIIVNQSNIESKELVNNTNSTVDNCHQVRFLEEQLKALKVKEIEYSNDLEVSIAEYDQLEESWGLLNNQKEACKTEIKNWVATFKEINNKEPDVKDKAIVKDKYQAYKTLTNSTKQVEDRKNELKLSQDKLSISLDEVRNEIVHIKELIKVQEQSTTSASKSFLVPSSLISTTNNATSLGANDVRIANNNYIKPDTSDAEIQTDDTLAVKLRKGMSQKLMDNTNEVNTTRASLTIDSGDKLQELELQHQADTQTIEQLDDQLYQINNNYEQIQVEKIKLMEELRMLTTQTEELIKAKRTDVVKKYEDDIESLLKTETLLKDKIANLTAEKTKNEAKINELLSRAENAESELKERDELEKKDLDPKDEKLLLKGKISQQRNDIILKQKATTAGWDAAANADGRLDVEIELAYKKGLTEERVNHKESMRCLNQAIEEKENRITQLLITFSEMERKVLQNEAEMKRMKLENEDLKLEVIDTIASLRTLGGGGSSSEDGTGSIDMITNEELENTREELNKTQEDLVELIERCDRLEQELEVSRKKNRTYEKLTEIVGLNNAEMLMKRVEVGAKSGNKSSSVPRAHDLSEVKNIINKSINKGTNLWKSNRKDECYDLYLETCEDCSERLLTTELKNYLQDAINNGKNLGFLNKQRGAVVLRKGLDKILSELEKPYVRNAEEAEASKLNDEATSAKTLLNSNTETNVVNLVNELNQIENSFLEQGYTKERNPSNSSAAGTELTTPRGENKDSASSLLARAKNAEAKIESLKKQLVTVLKSTTATEIITSQNTVPTATQNKDSLCTSAITASNGKRNIADPAEVRQLNRKIKELESKLKANSELGSNLDDVNLESKPSKQNDKVLEKKLKESEVLHKKELKNIDMRATKAENALKKMESTSGIAVRERDTLKEEVFKLRGEVIEIAQLRNKAEHAIELENVLQLKSAEYDQLTEQFKKETALRKKYKNELEDLKGAIRVYARCRPMAKYELEKGCKSVVQIKDETSLKLTTSRGEKEFEFDAVYGDKSTQDAVFEDTKRLVESCIDGFNVCLFAYGQTGSGKTFTMTGSSSMPGLTPKAIDELYRLISERNHLKVTVTTYFVELYNENLVDLYWIIDNKASKASNTEPPKLEIKMDEKKMVSVRNSVIKEVFSPSDLMELFNKGNVERHIGATKMNAESSRSHSIFSIMVECYDKATKRTTTGKLSLVDLAGSERADKTGAGAERLKEAQSINKSLSALGDVIAALSEGNAKHIPYRNNKLTQLMQDSLGGNAKTLMFVNFSPADYNSDETATSLMYAARVKKIVNNASKQAESEEVAKLKQIIKRLQSGQKLESDEQQQEEIQLPSIQDDDKVYDGY